MVPAAHVRLARVETETFLLWLDGYSAQGIANFRSVSLDTVKAQLKTVRAKLDVTSHAEALARVPRWEQTGT